MIQLFFDFYDSTSGRTLGHAVQAVRKIAARNSFAPYSLDGLVRRLQRIISGTHVEKATRICIDRFGIKVKRYAVGCWYESRGDAECHEGALEVRRSSGGFLAVTSFKF